MRCEECGYDYHTLPRDALPRRLIDLADDTVRAMHAFDDVTARLRPAEGVWSPLEYACHIRDVLLFQDRRVQQAQREDEPTFAPMNRDQRAADERYNDQDLHAVGTEMDRAAQALARTLEAMSEDGWQRGGGYGHPQPQLVTVEWVARHTVHELVHHLLDIERQARCPSTE